MSLLCDADECGFNPKVQVLELSISKARDRRAVLNNFALGLNDINNQHAGVDRRNDHKGLPSVAV